MIRKYEVQTTEFVGRRTYLLEARDPLEVSRLLESNKFIMVSGEVEFSQDTSFFIPVDEIAWVRVIPQETTRTTEKEVEPEDIDPRSLRNSPRNFKPRGT